MELVRGSAVTCILAGAEIAARLRPAVAGVQVVDDKNPPAGVAIVKADWPEARPIGRAGRGAAAAASEPAFEAGPTGEPWVNSIGWVVQLARARNPNAQVWVDAEPPRHPLTADEYTRAVADAASNGGRWILTLDTDLAAGLRDGKPASLEIWKQILRSCDFFQSHEAWGSYKRAARLGLVSDFSGDNEFLSQEFLNMATRNNQPCQVLEKSRLTDADLKGLRTAIYLDGGSPGAELRRKLLAYASAGGLLVTAQNWPQQGAPSAECTPVHDLHRRKGQSGRSQRCQSDPYLLVKDVPVLVSHRYDAVRLYVANAGILYYSVAPGGRGGLLQLVNFANAGGYNRQEWPLTAQVAERYETARLRTIDEPEPKDVEIGHKQGATQLFLPAISVYGAVELS